ncbi:cytochrome P450 [Microdochium trichocladiopsis]|uniref:Cytochrome P450 n=1 Tax=Microdochium trichocladiopsis TaxID=1682393 RepID=A0A9P9BJF5_9PEZI|nr:cytochrome P450 [Microdochium trichocladiopsis]KAH7018093.1 cytochrome P450 [Microdochium trichocladiopsis]
MLPSLADVQALLADILSQLGHVDPSSVSIPALGAGAVALYYTVSSLWSWFRLRHVPGPFLASFSYLWLMRTNALGISSTQLNRIRKQYGSVVRIAPNYVLTTDTHALRRISAPRSSYVRDSWWEGVRIDVETDNMLTTMDNTAHDVLKAKTTNGYNGRDNVDVEAGIGTQVDKLKDLIRRNYLASSDPSKPPAKADLVWLIRYFTLDSVTALAYGEPLGYLDADDDLYGFNKQVGDMTVQVAVMLNTPVLRTIINSPLGPSLMPKATDKDGMGKLIGIGQGLVAKHFKEDKDGSSTDMVSSFRRHGLSQKQCEAECQVQIIAGSDTTGTTIRTALFFTLSTPRIHAKLLDEINKAVDEGLVEEGETITYKQAKKLPYLQAVIYEAIRMRPPALYGHFKVVPPEGDTIDGVFLPGGTAVSHNIFGIMMSEDIFGADAEIFRPERLLECPAEHKAEMERVIELAFGSGRWLCAGKLVAFTQLSKVIFELLREFDMQLVNPLKPLEEDSAVFWRQKNLLVQIRERESL